MASVNLDNNLKDLVKADQPKLPDDFIGASYNNDAKTGISKFHLATMDGETPVILTGLLMELPEMSFTINYEDGPGNEWQDTIANFTGNSLMQLVNALGSANQGADWKNLVKVGTWTKKVYNGYSISNIPLKFRIYTADPLGQSSVDDWFLNLRKFAAISEENMMDPGLLVKNALSAYVNVEEAGERAAGSSPVTKINKIINANQNKSSEDAEAEAKEKYQKAKAENERAQRIFKKAAGSCLGTKFKIVITDGNGAIRSLMSLISDTSKNTSRKMNLYFASDSKNSNRLASTNIGNIMDPKFDKNPETYTDSNKPFTTNDIRTAFEGLDPKFGNDEDDKTTWNRVRTAVLNEMNRLDIGESYDDHESFSQNIKLIRELADSAGEFLVEKFNEYRVVNQFNKSNALGEKLWYLHLYENVIFNKNDPLIVYISDWSYQMSEEYDMNFNCPVYYEFTINCVLDQVYSRDVWQKKLYKEN